jgi:signal transduction histidine kinase
MDGVVAEVLAALAFQLQEVGAEVHVEPLPTCVADAVQTGQVFSNLIDNAIKYRHPGRPLRISVTGAVIDGQAVYSVGDNGSGIAPEHRNKVFEMFHRLNPETTTGEGLGLTIAQRVLERQRGRIWVESQVGEGSIFRVALPVPTPSRLGFA